MPTSEPPTEIMERGCRGSPLLTAGNSGSDPLLLSVPEAAKLLRISRNLVYELAAQKRLPHIRLGRIIRIPRFGLEQWIAREAGLPQRPPPVVSLPPQRH